MISQSAQLIRRLSCVAVLALTGIGCSSQPVSHSPSQSPSHSQSHPTPQSSNEPARVSSTADRAVAIALNQVGVPYRYGGVTPSGFDCSGLVHYSYSRAGKNVPRTTTTLWNSMRPVAGDQMRKGDILFFRISGKMSHVGMYIGGGQFVHAPSSGKVVSVGSLQSDFYRRALIRAGRPD